MQCTICRQASVLFQPYSGRHLCRRHLARDIEARAKRAVRAYHWMRSGDHIAVVVAGDRKSAALLCFLKKLTAGRRDIRLSAVPAPEGERGSDNQSAAIKVAESLHVPCLKMLPGSRSGTASGDNVTKLALAVSLDDIAEGVLVQFLFGNADRFVHPPPAGNSPVPVICPFITVPSDELDLYWEIEGTGIALPPVTPAQNALLQETKSLLRDYTSRHPATKFALLHLAEGLSSGNVAAIVAAGDTGPGNGRDKKIPATGDTEQLKKFICQL